MAEASAMTCDWSASARSAVPATCQFSSSLSRTIACTRPSVRRTSGSASTPWAAAHSRTRS
ncbi:Uncharacterised protein [Mycobacteroides abscessus subsp. abscessus]|nr:Uncharacterised protein [Mycobacteroides abscessus subsp. abscessus]